MERLWIALSSWKIEDGNYGSFRAGQRARLALNAALQTARFGAGDGPPLEWLRKARYRFHGQVAYRDDDACVLDLGFPVYVEPGTPIGAAVGSWCTGELVLSLAPSFYFARYSTRPGALPLICTWRIDRILRNVTPLIAAVEEAGRRTLLPDERREAFVEARATDVRAYRNRDYLMECTRLSAASWERFEPLSREEQEAVASLVGARVSVQFEEHDDNGNEYASSPFAATVLQVSGRESRDQIGLLRLDQPLIHAGSPNEYAVAYPRYEGEGFGRVAIEKVLFCSLKWLPAEQAVSEPFDHMQWPPGRGLAASVRMGDRPT